MLKGAALACLALAGCGWGGEAPDRRVVDPNGFGVPGATVVVHTTSGWMIDPGGAVFGRSSHFWVGTTDERGAYDVDARYRREATYAVADGFLAGFAYSPGPVALRPAAWDAPVAVELELTADLDAVSTGLDLATGATVSAADADLVLVGFEEDDPAARFEAPGGELAPLALPAAEGLHPATVVAFLAAEADAAGDPVGTFTPRAVDGGAWLVRLRDGRGVAKVHSRGHALSVDGRTLTRRLLVVRQAEPDASLGAPLDAAGLRARMPDGVWHEPGGAAD